MSEPAGARWLPAAAAGGEPHVLVDAGALPSTALALSHWPGSPTPLRWRRDTSTGCALAFLAESPCPDRWWDAGLPRVVATDHLDQDGLAAAALLLRPEEGARRGGVYEAVAAAGDFAVIGHDRDAARVSFALATLADPERSPLAVARTPAGPDRDGELGAELLERLPALVGEPSASRELWADEEAALVASLGAIASGSVVLREVPEDVPDRNRDVNRLLVPLAASVPWRARLAIAGFAAGGLAAVDAIEAADFDVLAVACRPRSSRVVARAVAVALGRAPADLRVVRSLGTWAQVA
jgi:hypothetical protein